MSAFVGKMRSKTIAEVDCLGLKTAVSWTLRGSASGTEARSDGNALLFRQTLAYDSCPPGRSGCAPQYEGNIVANSLFQATDSAYVRDDGGFVWQYAGVDSLGNPLYEYVGRLADSIPGLAHDYLYAYDMLNRLTAATDTASAHNATFVYDLRGRITGQSSGGNAPVSYVYNPKSDRLNRLSAPLVFADDSGHSRDLTAQNALKHDSSGALVGDASRENALSYDEAGRLVAVTRMTPEGLAKTRYVYGADGARLAKLTVAPSFPAVYTVGIHSADDDFATVNDACAALRSVEDSLPSEGSRD